MTRPLSRRGLLAGAVAVSSAGLIGACASSEQVAGGGSDDVPAGPYRTDVVLNSLRAMSIESLTEQATFARLPAAQAGQVFDWEFQSMDYTAQGAYMRDLAGWLSQARKVI